MLTIPLQCFLNDKNTFHINFTRSLTFQWKLLVMAKHEELFESKILVYVQPLITRLCLLRQSMRCFANISVINREREQSAIFVDYRLHYFCTVQYVTLWLCTDKLPVMTLTFLSILHQLTSLMNSTTLWKITMLTIFCMLFCEITTFPTSTASQ